MLAREENGDRYLLVGAPYRRLELMNIALILVYLRSDSALAFAFLFVQSKSRCASIVVLKVLTVSYTIVHRAHRKAQK